MRDPIDHERCSELLLPFVHGELDADAAAEVEAHLAGCPECSQERVALDVLTQGESPALTELERARLRRVVLSEAVPMPDEPATGSARQQASSGGSRLFQVLGAAALVAVIGGFAYLGLAGGVGGDDGGAGDTSAAVGGDSGEQESEETFDNDGAGRSARQTGKTSDAAGSTALGADAPAPSPTFEADLGLVDEERLTKLGRSGLPLVIFSRAYTTTDVEQRQSAFIEEVAAQAPTSRGNDIRECAATITAEFPRSLLAYAALAEFKDRGDILILAFAWTDEEAGPLDQSMVWAWSIGDCDGIPVHYSTNVIRPRN